MINKHMGRFSCHMIINLRSNPSTVSPIWRLTFDRWCAVKKKTTDWQRQYLSSTLKKKKKKRIFSKTFLCRLYSNGQIARALAHAHTRTHWQRKRETKRGCLIFHLEIQMLLKSTEHKGILHSRQDTLGWLIRTYRWNSSSIQTSYFWLSWVVIFTFIQQ